jgi:hypothetical protein
MAEGTDLFERRLGRDDFLKLAAVGAGDGLAIVLAVGARPEDEQISYPRSELAERYNASAVETTNDPQEAYTSAGHARPRHERPAYWNDLPWA